MAASKHVKRELSNVSTTFVAHNAFLKKFVARYFSSRQDVEDVVQEAYLRAYAAERERDIEQPKAFLFRIAKNVALTKLTRKSTQITDYLEEATAAAVIETAASADQEAAAPPLPRSVKCACGRPGSTISCSTMPVTEGNPSAA